MSIVTIEQLGFVFPGQGSQSIGMLKDLAAAYPIVATTFAEASAVLGYDSWQLVQDGPATTLNQTEYTQPALLAAGVAVWRCWTSRCGQVPQIMAGHSLGEYTALTCAGSLRFTDAVRLVSERGRLMADAVPDGSGAMVAVLGLEDAVLEALCEQGANGQVVQCTNFNAPGQIVIGGDRDAVHRVAELAQARGAKKIIPISMSVPSHCRLLEPAASRLAAILNGVAIEPPVIPVLHNADIELHPDGTTIRQVLSAQLYRAVRWVAIVRAMRARGVRTVIECGPGKVLTGLCKRIDKDLTCLAVSDPASLDSALAQVANG